MPEYLAPGLFVEEIDSGSKPIEGVGTNTACFIGFAKSGEFNKPVFITNWSQFCQQFGEEENALTSALCEEMGVTVSDLRAAKKASRKSWTEFAQQAIQKGVAAGAVSVKNWKEFTTKYRIPQGGLPYIEGSYLAHSVRGFYDNGGGRCYIVRVARKEDTEALAFQPTRLASASQITAGPLLIAPKLSAPDGDISVEVTHVGDGDQFTLKISQGDTTETFPEEGGAPLTAATAADVVNPKSAFVRVQKVATATEARPEAMLFTLPVAPANLPATTAAGGAIAPAGSPLSNGLANLRAEDFVGDEAQRTGLGGMIAIEDVNFIAIPDLMAGVFQRESVPGADPGTFGPEALVMDDHRKQAILAAQCALVAHCEMQANRMAILDPIPGLNPQEMNDLTLATPYNSDHGQAAIYYPWIKVADPLNKGQQILCPPSGHIAGVWVRTSLQRGVHKAPANEGVMGAVGLEYAVTKGEQELLNPNGINCIRAFPGMGIRVWGARTLATVGNPSWKYINVRRLFNFVEGSLESGLKWVVFEPNDSELWGRVRRAAASFMYTCWREGMLFGTSPAEAFYVKCDAETNPPEMIDLGRLYCEIGVNPVKPAEFVIIRVGQWASGSSVGE